MDILAVKEKIRKVIYNQASLNLPTLEPSAIDDRELSGDMGLDSLDMIEISMELGNTFCIEVDEIDITTAEPVTVNDIVTLIIVLLGDVDTTEEPFAKTPDKWSASYGNTMIKNAIKYMLSNAYGITDENCHIDICLSEENNVELRSK